MYILIYRNVSFFLGSSPFVPTTISSTEVHSNKQTTKVVSRQPSVSEQTTGTVTTGSKTKTDYTTTGNPVYLPHAALTLLKSTIPKDKRPFFVKTDNNVILILRCFRPKGNVSNSNYLNELSDFYCLRF